MHQMYMKRRHLEREYRQRYDAIHRGQMLVDGAKRRSSKKKMPYDLDAYRDLIEARVQKGLCELTGLPLDFHTKGMQWNSPSIDRIDSSAGYVYTNIRIVCFGMNAAMGNWGEKALRLIVTNWLAKTT